MKIRLTTYNCTLLDTELWHKRFGNVNYGSLKLTALSNLVDGLPLMSNNGKVYDISQFGTQKPAPFPKTIR